MGEKETVLDWGVHLLRHLQVLATSFLEHFTLDHVAQLKHDCFYGGLPKQLKAMVAYLKASINKKTYSDYLFAVREAEKEQAMEPSHSQTTDNTSKPKVTSFFLCVVHLEEEGSNKEGGTETEDHNGIEGVTEEFILHLTSRRRNAATIAAVWNILSVMHIDKGIQNSHPFKPKGGDSAREGSPDSSSQNSQAKGTPGGDTQGIGHCIQTPFFNPYPFHQWYGIGNVTQVRINRELYGPPQ